MYIAHCNYFYRTPIIGQRFGERDVDSIYPVSYTHLIDETVSESAVKNKTRCDGEPDEQDGTGHEPFPDAELIRCV